MSEPEDGLSEDDQKNTGNAVSVARKCKAWVQVKLKACSSSPKFLQVEKLLELTPSKVGSSCFSVRWLKSCPPFCSGCAGSCRLVPVGQACSWEALEGRSLMLEGQKP